MIFKKQIVTTACTLFLLSTFTPGTYAINDLEKKFTEYRQEREPKKGIINALKKVKFNKRDLGFVFGGPLAATLTYSIKKATLNSNAGVMERLISGTSDCVTLGSLLLTFVFIAKVGIGGFNSFMEGNG